MIIHTINSKIAVIIWNVGYCAVNLEKIVLFLGPMIFREMIWETTSEIPFGVLMITKTMMKISG